ncbi:transcriptional regulator with XRE-family HTH domain [Peribacillus deserti]|uniref:Transcriptional regulator with XRE-family HTH domain n=1 Tax=Peribacillus deserti TaxID=673318 RepID=A0ABS2QEF0_9BACI|nr:helix-turn-helix transcriptional regulator [Peribacillus deserti]MBM7691199.1 transcriptional regulator with XRE-family HTH domain [Peribacillus deserti]
MLGYGERLKELRLESSLTMEKAAKIVGIAKSTYAGYESEFRQPSLDKLSLFANYYRVSVDYLLNLTDQRERKEPSSHNAKVFLHSRELHWDGVPLQEEDLKQIRDFLQTVVEKNKINKVNDIG